MKRIARKFYLAVLVVLLVSCGTGSIGGNDPTPPSTGSFRFYNGYSSTIYYSVSDLNISGSVSANAYGTEHTNIPPGTYYYSITGAATRIATFGVTSGYRTTINLNYYGKIVPLEKTAQENTEQNYTSIVHHTANLRLLITNDDSAPLDSATLKGRIFCGEWADNTSVNTTEVTVNNGKAMLNLKEECPVNDNDAVELDITATGYKSERVIITPHSDNEQVNAFSIKLTHQ